MDYVKEKYLLTVVGGVRAHCGQIAFVIFGAEK